MKALLGVTAPLWVLLWLTAPEFAWRVLHLVFWFLVLGCF